MENEDPETVYAVVEAVRQATIFTHVGIETAFPAGSGHGPLNHMHAMIPRIVPPYGLHVDTISPRPLTKFDRPTASSPHPCTRILIQSAKKTWKEYVEHDFVKQLAQGTLPKECFLHFIKLVFASRPRASLTWQDRQDYLYLKYYARAYGYVIPQQLRSASVVC